MASNIKVALYVVHDVPSNSRVTVTQSILAITRVIFAQWFGGFTEQRAKGGWLNGKGELVLDDITILYSFTTEDVLDRVREAVYQLAGRIGRELHQESVAVEINGAMEFITP